MLKFDGVFKGNLLNAFKYLNVYHKVGGQIKVIMMEIFLSDL